VRTGGWVSVHGDQWAKAGLQEPQIHFVSCLEQSNHTGACPGRAGRDTADPPPELWAQPLPAGSGGPCPGAEPPGPGLGGQVVVRGQSPDGSVVTPPHAAAGTLETWPSLRTPAAACRRRGRGRCQAPLTRRAPARHSGLGQRRSVSSLAPVRSGPGASGECAGRRGRRWEPAWTGAVPPPRAPARSEVAAPRSSRRGARARSATNFGGRPRAGVGGRGLRRRRLRRVAVARGPLPAPSLSFPSRRGRARTGSSPLRAAWRRLGGRRRLGSADTVRWAGGRRVPRSWGAGWVWRGEPRAAGTSSHCQRPGSARDLVGAARSREAKEGCWGPSRPTSAPGVSGPCGVLPESQGCQRDGWAVICQWPRSCRGTKCALRSPVLP
jgi:hypothetical protein